MAVAKRMTKEELREDKVMTALKELGDIAKENSRALLIALLVLVAAIAAWIFFQQSRARAEENAAVSLYQAQQYYFSGRYSEALPLLESIVGQYGSTRAGKLAPLFLGNAKLAAGDAAGAQQAFAALDPGSDPLLVAAADRGKAAALADLGQLAEAGQLYLTAAGREGNPLAADDYMAAGAALFDAGQRDEAKAAFQKVVDEHADSPRAAEARVRVAEIEAAG